MARPREESDESGDGYFASISDLMVGILFIFLLMLSVFAIKYADDDKDKIIEDLKKQVSALTAERNDLQGLVKEQEAEIARLRQQVSDLTSQRDRLREGVTELVKQLEGVSLGLRDDQGRLQTVRESLLQTLKGNLKRRDVEVELDAGQGILRLSSQGLFELDKDEFTAKGKDNATALLEEMARLLPCYSKPSENSGKCESPQPIFETVLIEGHTDTLPTDRRGGNWTLSTDRARAFLELMGGSAASLRDLRNNSGQPLVGLAGYGDSRPRADIPGSDDRNRRIEVRFLLSGDRGNLQGRIRRLDDLLQELHNLTKPQP
jgi:chemotaxis protein MotB